MRLVDLEIVTGPMPTPTPTPTHPVAPGIDVGTVLHSFGTGLWLAISSSPWSVALFALFVLTIVIRAVHAVAHPSGRRDPVRRFSRQDKSEILRRAGGRCEHHGWMFGRGKRTEGLEADHIHPHSRGGQTNVSNGQALCKHHNRSKLATIPFNWQLRALARRRVSYFPAGLPTNVIRKAPAQRR